MDANSKAVIAPIKARELVNLDGIEPVVRLAFDFVTAIADDPRPSRPFRPQCRSESAATRRALEAPAAEPPVSAGQRPRWGMGTRSDPGEQIGTAHV